jgi:hypothetical protein
MMNMMEDFYIPMRGNDTATKIDTTKGLDYSGIEDVQYLRDKLFAALKVPKAFMGYEKDLTGKATLSERSDLNYWCEPEIRCEEGIVPKVVKKRQTTMPANKIIR